MARMQWYVSNEGNVAGPLSADEVKEAIEDGTIEVGMFVRDEQGQWGPIEQSPFAGLLPQVEVFADSPVTQLAMRPKPDSLWGWWLVIGLGCVAGSWLVFNTWRANQPQEPWAVPATKYVYEAPSPTPAPNSETATFRVATIDGSSCRVLLTSNERIPVPIFPTEAGWREFQTAAHESNEAMHQVATRRGAFWVNANTPCKLLRRDKSPEGYSHIKIAGGEHAERVGFTNFSMVVER